MLSGDLHDMKEVEAHMEKVRPREFFILYTSISDDEIEGLIHAAFLEQEAGLERRCVKLGLSCRNYLRLKDER